MIPAAWVRLAELPLTPNGKLDRKALPDPGEPASLTGETFVAPRTMIEEVLAAIWRQVLNLDRISRDVALLHAGRPFAAGDANHFTRSREFSGGNAFAKPIRNACVVGVSRTDRSVDDSGCKQACPATATC